MLIEQTVTKLSAMKLFGMANSLKERTSRPDHADLSVTDFVSFLVDDEWTDRQNRKLTSRLKTARFKDQGACVEDIDYETSRGLKKTKLLEFLQNHWIDKHQNIVLTGPSGSGKSYLAQAIGNHLCRSGFAVTYMRMPKLAVLLTQVRADGTYMRTLERIRRSRVLILDDLGISSKSSRTVTLKAQPSSRRNFRRVTGTSTWAAELLPTGSAIAFFTMPTGLICRRRSRSGNQKPD